MGCVARCLNAGGGTKHDAAVCVHCPVEGPNGRMRCPNGDRPLYWIEYVAETKRARYACNGLKGCGLGVSFPVGDLDALGVERETKKRRRQRLQAQWQRRYRQRQTAGVGSGG